MRYEVHLSMLYIDFGPLKGPYRRSQWSRGLRRRSATARLLRLWFRIPPAAWMSVCHDCCVLSGRGLCEELIIRPEESYRLCCVVVCDLETSCMKRPRPSGGCRAQNKETKRAYHSSGGLVSIFPPRGRGFSSTSVHLRFVVDRVALGLAFLRVLGFSSFSIIPSVFHIHVHLYVTVSRRTNKRSLGISQQLESVG